MKRYFCFPILSFQKISRKSRIHYDCETSDVTQEEDEDGNYYLSEIPGSLVRISETSLGMIDKEGGISIYPSSTEEITD